MHTHGTKTIHQLTGTKELANQNTRSLSENSKQRKIKTAFQIYLNYVIAPFSQVIVATCSEELLTEHQRQRNSSKNSSVHA